MAVQNTRWRNLPVRMTQNVHLTWLAENIDEKNEDCHNTIMKLRQVVNTVNTFVDVDECIDFVTDATEETAFMMVSEKFARKLIPVIQNISQVKAVYIFNKRNMQSNEWNNSKMTKIAGLFTNIELICESLTKACKEYDRNAISISFVKTSGATSNVNKDILDCSFMYTQVLKEILLAIEFNDKHREGFLTYCQKEFAGNAKEMKNIDRMKREYDDHQPIWWYTGESFLYPMLNRALRLMDVDIILKIAFFLCDLHNHIAALHTEQFSRQTNAKKFVVYRGQGLNQIDFDQLKNNQGGLMAFNNFLSTSINREISLRFIRQTMARSDLVGVLFIMTIDPSIQGTPFADVKNASYYKGEEEILFSMHSIFRIGQIQQIDGDIRIWEVQLTLTNDNDPQMRQLTERMQKEIDASHKGWHRLGHLLLILAKFDKAKELYEMLLEQTTDQREKSVILTYLGAISVKEGNYDMGFTFYEEALEIGKKYFPSDDPSLANLYNNIALMHNKMDEYSKALEYYQKSLEIKKKTLPVSLHSLAASHNNIGSVYREMGNYSKALEYYEESLKISKETLPDNHPDLAVIYNNIGLMCDKLRKYSQALEYHQKSLEIKKKILPTNHPSLASSYNNIGSVYREMEHFSKALEYCEKSFEVKKKILHENHPDLAAAYNNIGWLYSDMNNYKKGLEYFERALTILRCSLPDNHPKIRSIKESIEKMKKQM